MTLLTYAQFKASRATIVAGLCADSPEFKQLTNASVERLLQRGDWVGTVVGIQLCVKDGCCVWPRYVGELRAVNTCDTTIPTRNFWYEFLQFDRKHVGCGSGNVACEVYGTTPTYADVRGTDKKIRAYIDVQADIGKTVTIYGLDSNGQVIRTKQSDGTWIDGTVLTLVIPFASTSMDVQSIYRISKDLTQGNVRIFEYNTVLDTLRDLAVYAPSETEPNYQRSKVSPVRSGCGCLTQIKAVVKLQFIPIILDTDLMLISNTSAIKLMSQCIKAEEANNFDAADKFEARAIRELNLELRDQYPDDTIPVSVNGFGSALPSRAGIGSII